jgi:IS5 family transposase
MVEIAMENKVVAGKRMRVDTTVVETNIHYPTDSSLLGDGTRVLTRVMKKAEEAAGGLIGKVRDRMRTVRRKVMAIAIAARQKGAAGEEKRRHIYKGLLSVTRKVVNQAKRVMGEVDGMARCRKQQLSGLRTQRATMVERVEQVIRQTRERVFGGNTKFETKLVSVFEPQTEIIQGQGEQAYGVRQAGQDPGSRESDRDAFRGLPGTAHGLSAAGGSRRSTSTAVGFDTASGGGGCRILLAGQ